jgi:histidinol-phosphate phosphatase family protein
VVTIQSRIGKGTYSEQQFLEWFGTFQAVWRNAGAILLGPYVCPHRFNTGCDCAKPKPLLYLRAARQHCIDCARSFVVGDTASDVQAAMSIGAMGCLVLTGWGEAARPDCADAAAFVGKDLADVVDWILNQTSKSD